MHSRLLASSFTVALLAASLACGADTFCFGPTGAWGELDGHMLRVTYIAPCSPAAGILEPDDRIFGANDFLFPKGGDPRAHFADAIARSAGRRRKGGLDLKIKREGSRRINYRIVIRPVGTYSDTWPSDCEKSKAILDDACRFVHDHTTPGNGLCINALLLLASGDRAYADYVRRSAYTVAANREACNTANASYRLLFLCEYYLATGDASAWGRMTTLADTLSRTWGSAGQRNLHHDIARSQAMVLADECGLPTDKEALLEARKCTERIPPAPAGNRSASIPELLWLPVLLISGPDTDYRTFLDAHWRQLELARTHDGAFCVNGTGISSQPECNTTAALAMVYAGSAGNLRIMGKPRTVFGTRPPCPATARALELFREKEWDQLSSWLESFSSRDRKSLDYAAELRRALQDLEAATAAELKEVETTAQSGDLYRAGLHLQGLETRMGARLPSTARLRRALASPKGRARIDVGRAVYEARTTYSMGCYQLDPATMTRLRGLVNTGDECYDYMARHMLKRTEPGLARTRRLSRPGTR